jgi:hypothetical protein
LLDLLQPNQVTVRLDNNGQFDVDAVVIYSDQTDVPEDLIGTIGTRLEFTIPAGGSQSFTRSCGSLRAIQIQDASLRVLGGVGPHTSSGVYREGTDYTCGDTLTFAFEHSALIVDFHVTFSAQ